MYERPQVHSKWACETPKVSLVITTPCGSWFPHYSLMTAQEGGASKRGNEISLSICKVDEFQKHWVHRINNVTRTQRHILRHGFGAKVQRQYQNSWWDSNRDRWIGGTPGSGNGYLGHFQLAHSTPLKESLHATNSSDMKTTENERHQQLPGWLSGLRCSALQEYWAVCSNPGWYRPSCIPKSGSLSKFLAFLSL